MHVWYVVVMLSGLLSKGDEVLVVAKGKRRGRPPSIRTILAGRVQEYLPFDCPNLRWLTEKELRHLERHLSEITDAEPVCSIIGK